MHDHFTPTFDLGTDGLITDEPAVLTWMQGINDATPQR